MRTAGLVGGALLALVCGCVSSRAHLESVAANQHRCPRGRTHVVESAGHWTYWVDVCGRRRLYSMQGGRVEDVTGSLGGDASGTSSGGFSGPRWNSRELQTLVEAATPAVRACYPAGRDAALRVSVTVNRRGAVVYARVLGDATGTERECMSAALGAVRVASEREGRETTTILEWPRLSPAESPAPTEVPAPVAAPALHAVSDEASLRARIGAASAAVLACLGADAAALDVVVSMSGVVDVSVHGGSAGPEDGCVRAAVGALHMEPAPAAELRILHAVTR